MPTAEETRERKARWAREKYQADREAGAAAARARRAANPEASRQASRGYYDRNQERLREEAREREAARTAAMTPDERHARSADRWQREKGREHVHEAKMNEQAALRLEVLLAYGGRCACCGTDYLPHLALDHIDGGGAEERRRFRGSTTLLRHLRREGFPAGYQVLCHNCNWAKYVLGACGCQEAAPDGAAQEPCAGGVREWPLQQ